MNLYKQATEIKLAVCAGRLGEKGQPRKTYENTIETKMGKVADARKGAWQNENMKLLEHVKENTKM